MYSAFGVEHDISKKIPSGMRLKFPQETDDMARRLKVNYSQFRARSDFASRGINAMKKTDPDSELLQRKLVRARKGKLAAKAQVDGVNSINRRRPGRFLP